MKAKRFLLCSPQFSYDVANIGKVLQTTFIVGCFFAFNNILHCYLLFRAYSLSATKVVYKNGKRKERGDHFFHFKNYILFHSSDQ